MHDMQNENAMTCICKRMQSYTNMSECTVPTYIQMQMQDANDLRTLPNLSYHKEVKFLLGSRV
jgi:hypothetical protein